MFLFISSRLKQAEGWQSKRSGGSEGRSPPPPPICRVATSFAINFIFFAFNPLKRFRVALSVVCWRRRRGLKVLDLGKN